jgi:hypothetical protein
MAATKEKEAKTSTEERLVISPSFDAETYAKIKALAEADERSMAQYLTRFVREKIKEVQVPGDAMKSPVKDHASHSTVSA